MTSDNDLIISVIKGNKAAFEELLCRYDEKVLSIAYGYVNSSEDAKDIYQDVFIRVYNNLHKFEFRSEFSTWLYRITVNTCLSHKSKNKNHRHFSFDDIQKDKEDCPFSLKETLDSGAGTDSETLMAEMMIRIKSAVEKLPPKQKMVFTLKYFHEHKIKEIAGMMNCTEGTVKKLLSVGTGKIRKEVKEYL